MDEKSKQSEFTVHFLLLLNLIIQSGAAGENNFTSPPLMVTKAPNSTLFQVADSDGVNFPFVMECEATGSPTPKYKWTKNGKTFEWQTYADRIVERKGYGTLTFLYPKDEDVGYYQCFAENSFGIATSNSVFWRKSELENFPDKEVAVLVAEEGKPFGIPCEGPRGWPKPRLDWLFLNSAGSSKNISSYRIAVDPEGTLWFSNITRTDASADFMYTCVASSPFRKKGKFGNRVYLTVSRVNNSFIENQHHPVLQYASPAMVTVLKGTTLELWCIVGGTPLPEIQWSKVNGSLLEMGAEFANHRRTLRIQDVDFDAGGTYECNAANGFLEPVKHWVHVRVHALPYFIITPVLKTTAPNETVELNCYAGGQPTPTITWIHNGKPLKEVSPNPSRTLEGTNLNLTNVQREDTGNYGCNASNEHGYIYEDVYVNVILLAPTIREKPGEIVVNAGHAYLYIACGAIGFPAPSIIWLHNGLEFSFDKHLYVDEDNDLSIKDVNYTDTGVYTCIATNKYGIAEKNFTLSVKAATEILEGPMNKTVRRDGSVTFNCIVKADAPLTYTIEWSHNQHPLDFKNARFVKLENNSLVVKGARVDDGGMYGCLVKTGHDNSSQSAYLVVGDVPSRPQLLSVQCEEYTAAIHWTTSTGGNPLPITSYAIESYTNLAPDVWRLERYEFGANYTTVHMEPWRNYTFRVIANNSVGFSLPSEKSTPCTSFETIPSRNPENIRIGCRNETKAGTLCITWTPVPIEFHNSLGMRYEVSWKEDESVTRWKTEVVYDWRRAELQIPNQRIYFQYVTQVVAANRKGRRILDRNFFIRGYSQEGIPSEAPSTFQVRRHLTPRSVVVSWSPVSPASLQGHHEGYKIHVWSDYDPDGVYAEVLVPTNVTTEIVERLWPFTFNYLRIFAYNAKFRGPGSRVLTVLTSEAPAGPVKNLRIRSLGTFALYVEWTAPENVFGILMGYGIDYTLVVEKEVKWDRMKSKPNITDTDRISAKIGGLEANTTYRVHVYAFTNAGSERKLYFDATTDSVTSREIAKPSFELVQKRGQVHIRWIPNFKGPGQPGSTFSVQYRKSGVSGWRSKPEVHEDDFDVLSHLEPKVTYAVRVVARDGEFSIPSDEQVFKNDSVVEISKAFGL